jgi:hypothetical protein
MTNAEIFNTEIVPQINERLRLGFGLKQKVQIVLAEDGHHMTANGETVKAQINENDWRDLQSPNKPRGGYYGPSTLLEFIVLLSTEIYLELTVSAIKKIVDVLRATLRSNNISWDGEYRFPHSSIIKDKWGIKINGYPLQLDEPLNIEIPSSYIDKKFVTKLLLKSKLSIEA